MPKYKVLIECAIDGKPRRVGEIVSIPADHYSVTVCNHFKQIEEVKEIEAPVIDEKPVAPAAAKPVTPVVFNAKK